MRYNHVKDDLKHGEKIPVSEVRGGKGTATLYDVNGHFLRKVQDVNSKPQD